MAHFHGIFGRMSGLHGMTDRSLKQLISWGDHLKVGQPNIDAQHQAIFNLAVDVADTWHRHGDLSQLKILAEKLDSVLRAHFRYEELPLEEVGYTRLEEHKLEHKMMLGELRGLRHRLEKMKPGSAQMAPGFQLHNFILGVTVGHICHNDMDYCVFARKAAENKKRSGPQQPNVVSVR
jgi:hemerythrin